MRLFAPDLREAYLSPSGLFMLRLSSLMAPKLVVCTYDLGDISLHHAWNAVSDTAYRHPHEQSLEQGLSTGRLPRASSQSMTFLRASTKKRRNECYDDLSSLYCLCCCTVALQLATYLFQSHNVDILFVQRPHSALELRSSFYS